MPKAILKKHRHEIKSISIKHLAQNHTDPMHYPLAHDAMQLHICTYKVEPLPHGMMVK
jgi:hypothetical protein